MKIFVAHYTPLTERKKHILDEFKKHNISDFEFIETHDKEQLTEMELNLFSNISSAECSCFLKHIEIFKKIYKDDGNHDNFSLIFEDDAMLIPKFNDELECYMKTIPDNFDIIFPGECANLHIKTTEPNKHFYKTCSARGTCFYIVNNNIVKKILDKFNEDTQHNKILVPVDWWFNKIIPELNLQSYWTEPTLVYQGSEIGSIKSAIC